MTRSIFVTFQFEGFHQWPDAPDDQRYLRNLHRHMFHVRVELGVDHNDRDLEFIEVKHACQKFVEDMQARKCWGTTVSCEQIAESLVLFLEHYYDLREKAVIVTVSEDGENGATVASY